MQSAAVFPRKLVAGDEIRVVAPSRSRAMVMRSDHSRVIEARFARLGLRLTYGAHVDELDAFDSSAIPSRVADLHDAFRDPDVAAVLTVIGGFNANELLPYLDWDLIGDNPKVFCGYSDITALLAAVHARTGLVTYLGPHWSSFGMRDHFDQTEQWFARTLMDGAPVELRPASDWTDDLWFLDQDDRTVLAGEGWWRLRSGETESRLLAGNLCTLNLLQGTPWMPSLDGVILAVEDDGRSDPPTFARDLTSLLQTVDAETVRGLIIGRFQRESRMTRELLAEIVNRQPLGEHVPILADVDFGHTNPQATLPIGGTVRLRVDSDDAQVVLVRH